MLFQSHIYCIRVLKPDVLSPWLLFASLNSPIVKRQIRAKQFTQDIIDTLGRRLWEIILPIPKSATVRKNLTDETKKIIQTRATLRNRAKELVVEIEGREAVAEDDIVGPL